MGIRHRIAVGLWTGLVLAPGLGWWSTGRVEGAALGPVAIQGPVVSAPVTPRLSPPLDRLPVEPPDEGASPAREVPSLRRLGPPPWAPGNLVGGEDPLLVHARALATGARTPSPSLTFAGIGNLDNTVPPDPVGDVGPSHYVQMVNVRLAVYSKAGVLLTGPVNINALWAGAGNRCELDNDGDPVVLYDPLADRWLVSQFALPGGPAGLHLCVAISTSPDPAGSYFLYDFAVPVFPDYPKYGVWPDAFYVATNENSGAGTGDVGVYALDRAKMLLGQPATFQRFAALNVNFLLPADLDGFTPPPAGTPGLFYTFSDSATWGGASDRLDLYEFHVDFATPANSTFTLDQSVTITAFTYTVCGYFVFACIPEPAPGEKVDAVSEWPMFRFPYRNFGTHETLVGNFTVDVGSDRAGIRWFELRRTGGGAWSLQQEGTHAPGTEHRFMGSIAVDGSGNIALGYSTSSAGVTPALRYATRLASDPSGTLQAEAVLQAGGGVQTAGGNRWGDYSAMTVDPADDCTFWYTGEYYAATSASGWSTRVGRFKLPECVPHAEIDVEPSPVAFGLVPVGGAGARTVTVRNTGSAFLTLGTLGLGGTDAGQFALGSDLCSGRYLAPAASCTAQAEFKPVDGGPLSGTLSIPSNDADENPRVLALSGTGGGPEILVGPTAVDFGSVPVGTQATRTVTIQNVGTADLALGPVRVLPNQGPAFRTPRRGHQCAGVQTLAPGESCTVDVLMRALVPGPRSGGLRIRSGDGNEPEVLVPLSGTGTP